MTTLRGAARAELECPVLDWRWLDTTPSTMDAAREMLRSRPGGTSGPLAVATSRQTAGRGTRGRAWHDAGGGNVALTIALPRDEVALAPITLAPLRIGVEIAKVIEAGPPLDKQVRVKWPNDVLLGDEKVAGILIEAFDDSLLVGVGVNVASAPHVPDAGSDRGRAATCLADRGSTEAAEELARRLADAVGLWAAGHDAAAAVVAEWSARVDWTASLVVRETGERVSPVRLLPDGRLRVRGGDGAERDLVAEYLF